MTSGELFEGINSLQLNPEEYIVIGSAVLCALEIREVNDLDLVVSEELFKQFESGNTWGRKYFEDGDYYLTKGIYEIGRGWGIANNEPNLKQLKEQQIIINDIPFISLGFLRGWKAYKGREKDLEDIKLIDEYLKR